METEKELLEGSSWSEQVAKMQALENGTRGFNAKAASDQKLRLNQQICAALYLWNALDIVETEMVNRGLISQTTKQKNRQAATQQAQAQSQKVNLTIELNADDFHPADGFFVRDAEDANEAIKNSMAVPESTRHLLVSLIWALCLQKPSGFIQAIKAFLVNNCDYSEDRIKETINKCLNSPEIITSLNQGTKEIKTN